MPHLAVILVTGATGNVGRQVVEQLLEAGEKVRAISQNPESASLSDSVEVLQGDLSRPGTLPAALRGVDRAFLFPVQGQLGGFLDAARDAALGRVVLLSSMAVIYQPPNAVGRVHAECEQAVTESGLPWTFLRPGGFIANDLRWAADIKAAGVVRDFGGDVSSAPIDEHDIAAVAVRALLNDGHSGHAYLLTGPEVLTLAERVRILGGVLGRELRFEEETHEQARERMITSFPAPFVDSLLAGPARAAGRPAKVSPTVREVTGRNGHTYADWAVHRAADSSADVACASAGRRSSISYTRFSLTIATPSANTRGSDQDDGQ